MGPGTNNVKKWGLKKWGLAPIIKKWGLAPIIGTNNNIGVGIIYE
jgi:hypothetical protein